MLCVDPPPSVPRVRLWVLNPDVPAETSRVRFPTSLQKCHGFDSGVPAVGGLSLQAPLSKDTLTYSRSFVRLIGIHAVPYEDIRKNGMNRKQLRLCFHKADQGKELSLFDRVLLQLECTWPNVYSIGLGVGPLD